MTAPNHPVGRPAAVLFDRDGTLVRDVPYNADPDRVTPMPGAQQAVAQLRGRGVRLGVVSNQSGVARGLISADALRRVNRRVDELFGGFDTWQTCPHGPEDGCACRKPRPGLILAAARDLGVHTAACVVIGDIGADVAAATAAGAAAVLVPTPITRADEVVAAPRIAEDLVSAVEWVLGGEPAIPRGGAR